MSAWPWNLAQILRTNYTESVDENVRRTSFDDGAIAQKRIAGRDWLIRRFDIFVKESNLTAMRAWLRTWAHRDFDFVDLDGTTRKVRVRGGNGAVEFQAQEGFLEDERYFSASVELEGIGDS